jgi:hypothetical protein
MEREQLHEGRRDAARSGAKVGEEAVNIERLLRSFDVRAGHDVNMAMVKHRLRGGLSIRLELELLIGVVGGSFGELVVIQRLI